MDNRTPDQAALLKEVIDRSISGINTSIPGIIDFFDSNTQTATVIPAIKMRTVIDEEESFLEYPPILNVPVCFYMVGVKGFGITLPVSKGDSCKLSFSQRSIDHWHELGGIQPPVEGKGSRHHDLTDAIAVIGPLALPDVFDNWEENGLEIRNRGKTARITLKDNIIEIEKGSSLITIDSSGNINMISTTIININAPIANINAPITNLSGNLNVVGDIISSTGDIKSTIGDVADSLGSIQGNRNAYNPHKHNENGDGGGITDPPDPQMT